MFLTFQGNEPWPAGFHHILELSPKLRNEVAFPWIRSDVGAPIAFPNFPASSSAQEEILYVVDDELAWAYIVAKDEKEGGGYMRWCFDAIEYNPDASAVMHRVFNTLRRKGRVPTPDHHRDLNWWFDFQKEVENASGLHWRVPYIELNPAVQY